MNRLCHVSISALIILCRLFTTLTKSFGALNDTCLSNYNVLEITLFFKLRVHVHF